MTEINADKIICDTNIKKMVHFESISSTNDWGKRFIYDQQQKIKQGNFGDSFPFLVLADRQTAGRGRGNHSWFSPNGSLLFSLLTTWSQLSLSRRDCSTLSLQIATAVQKTIIRFLNNSNDIISFSLAEKSENKTLSNRIRIKPPNDIYADDKKIAGILIESPNEQTVVIGIGVNINNSVEMKKAQEIPNDLRQKIISIIDLTQREIDIQSFLIALINEIV